MAKTEVKSKIRTYEQAADCVRRLESCGNPSPELMRALVADYAKDGRAINAGLLREDFGYRKRAYKRICNVLYGVAKDMLADGEKARQRASKQGGVEQRCLFS